MLKGWADRGRWAARREWAGGDAANEKGAMACIAGGYAFQVYFWLSGRS
jgi:hypothetical protein